MNWNWKSTDWPLFTWDASAIQALEDQFKVESAKLIGASSIITEGEQESFTIDLMSEEALQTSRIEGETLNRDSVASSLLRQFGFAPADIHGQVTNKEKGVAALMVDNFRSYDQPLTHDTLFLWHPCIVTRSLLVREVGQYRTGSEPMRVVSGYEGRQTVHYIAPPADRVPEEMNAYIKWFNDTAPDGKNPLPAITRAGIAHLYFESIHPFADGNGRIGRALSEKALAQSLGKPGLFALSHVIEKNRAEYYKQLEQNQKDSLAIDGWLSYFATTTLKAVGHSQKLVRFIVEKTRLYDRIRGQLNDRQTKVMARVFSEGMDGFKGGLNADKYMKMTGAISKTATRDLQELVELGALTKTGKLKGTRYWLNLGQEFEIEKNKHLAEYARSSELKARRSKEVERSC